MSLYLFFSLGIIPSNSFLKVYQMSKNKSALLKKTVNTWQPRYQKKLTSEDARGIIENMTGFFNTLQEWEQSNCLKSAENIQIHLGKQDVR